MFIFSFVIYKHKLFFTTDMARRSSVTSLSEDALDENASPKPYSGRCEGSYAYLTIKDRMPVILTKVIDSLCREKHTIGTQYGEVAKEELKAVIGDLSALHSEMATNKPIKPLVDERTDVAIWNEYLETEIKQSDFIPAWYDSAWMYVECYMYRRIKQAFQLSTTLKDYDPFCKLKQDSFLSSMSAAGALAQSLEDALSEIGISHDTALIHRYFTAFLEVSLWGNKCDLSLTAGQEHQVTSSPVDQLQELRQSIIVNDSETVWEIIQEANKTNYRKVRVDLVLDNAGFELFTDLCFLHFLVSTNLVATVHMYVKSIPWYVSDTLEKDIRWLLETLSNSKAAILVKYSKMWTENIAYRRWVIEKEPFWTLPHSFSEMRSADPHLYSKLSQSNLIIFKGDLNYRKLTSDLQWEDTTPFVTSLRDFLPSSLVTLRAVKADVITGLELGMSQDLDKISSNWRYTGDFAVIQCVRKS